MIVPPQRNSENEMLTNIHGETLVIKATISFFGIRIFIVDSEDDRIFNYLADCMNTLEDFWNFLDGRSFLTEEEFRILLILFDFPPYIPHESLQ